MRVLSLGKEPSGSPAGSNRRGLPFAARPSSATRAQNKRSRYRKAGTSSDRPAGPVPRCAAGVPRRSEMIRRARLRKGNAGRRPRAKQVVVPKTFTIRRYRSLETLVHLSPRLLGIWGTKSVDSIGKHAPCERRHSCPGGGVSGDGAGYGTAASATD